MDKDNSRHAHVNFALTAFADRRGISPLKGKKLRRDQKSPHGGFFGCQDGGFWCRMINEHSFSLSMNHLQDILLHLGFDQSEIDVYQLSLKLGPATLDALTEQSKKTKLTTAAATDSLLRRGLMRQRDEDGHQLFLLNIPANYKRILKIKLLYCRRRRQAPSNIFLDEKTP
jgi:predicted DNA-binding transcriptional regulator